MKAPAHVKEDEETVDYDEALQEADVALLTRSQRRARAKLLMKKSRRLGNNNPAIENRQAPFDIIQHAGERIDGEPNAFDLNNAVKGPALTRKQRQRAAKELERTERKANDEKVRNQKRLEDEERQVRAKMQQDKKSQAAVNQKERSDREFREWKYMFPDSDLDTNVTVKEFVEELQINPIISLEETSEEFSVSVVDLSRRLRQLECDGRIGLGIFNADEDLFVYINHQFMESTAKMISSAGKISLREFAQRISPMVLGDYKGSAHKKDTDANIHVREKKIQ